MDLFSRKIIALRLSDTLEAKWIFERIQEAKKARRITRPLVCHSDRGFQYVSTIFLKVLDTIIPSNSHKARPWQNACIEFFHALIKREWLYSFKNKDF
jgi:transposase InsO family protein